MRATLLRWCISLVGVQLLCVVTWVLGPLLPPLEGAGPRLATVLGLLAAWAGGNLLLDWRRRARDRALAQGVVTAEKDEAAAVGGKLAEALALLRRARGRRGALYEQPWYVIIGPPGAGKTTALLNAGLRFPLAGAMGRGAVAGVGGTRLCEWWFTDAAVLIDTAGRYTTQDSDSAVDRAGWEAFLRLLRRTRPRQPLNGVIVAIALNDVVLGAAEERAAHAAAVRRRLAELEAQLGVVLPVYAVFTKADLLAGFTEFFADLDRAGREQVWGMTFPLRPAPADPAAAFAAEFRLLAERLRRRMLDRLQAEPGADRRAAIAAFPAQLASLEGPLQAFMTEAFGAEAGSAPMLRGAYLTSATQEGTPFDRMTGALARAFGLRQLRPPRLRPEEGRSFFLAGLLRDVVFNEAMLASEQQHAARRRQAVRAMAFAACALLAAAASATLWRERAASQAAVDTAAAALAAYEQAASALPLDPVADADLPALLPWLNQARAMAGQREAPPGWLGLGQEGKLRAGAQAVYRHALRHAFFPRLVWRLEALMRGNPGRPDFSYEATRIYLMLGGSGPLDSAPVREWMTLDWEGAYPGSANAALRAGLSRHLDALLAEPLPAVMLDGELVRAARAAFNRVSLAQRVYARIRPSAAAQRLPPWRPSDALGPAGMQVFIRASGLPLNEGIPGFYTADGFRTVVLPSLGSAAQEVMSESWVLGEAAEPDGSAMRDLERDVVALYATDLFQHWDAMLADLDVAPLRSLSQAAQDLYILASPHSPLRELLASAARQLTLPAGEPAASAAPSRLQAVLGRPALAAPVQKPLGAEISDRYKPLRDLFGTGGAAPIDGALRPVSDLQQTLAKIAATARSVAPSPASGDDPAAALRAEAMRQPQPLGRWLNAMAASGAALRGGGPRQQAVAAFNTGGGPASLCRAVVADRYPFTPGAAKEASLEEFTRVFGPGGALDGFFNTHLKPYVDTAAKPWKLQAADGAPAPVTPADLAQFQRAAALKDLFFPRSGASPQLRLYVTPTGMDPGASRVTLDLGAAALTFTRDAPPRPAEISWPLPGHPDVRLTLEAPASGNLVLQDSGPWAMLRLLARGRTQPAGSPDRYTLLFRAGERQAAFDVRATVPPALAALQEFRCPAVQ